MNSSSFENAPQLGNEFENAQNNFTEQQIETEQKESQKEPDDDFTDLRSIDEVPGAAEEYEAYISEQDDFEQRMMDRFNHAKENEFER